MGTRADFYIGVGKNAQWLGSIAWDGHSENFARLMNATTERYFTGLVQDEVATRDDYTSPESGWPWPWNDSRTTDYAYCWDASAGKTRAFLFGREFDTEADPDGEEGFLEPDEEIDRWPDMSNVKNVQFNARKGGVFIATLPGRNQ